MPVDDAGYSILTALFALFVGYILGRVHASARDPRRVDEKKRAAAVAERTADENLRQLTPDVRAKVETLISNDHIIEAIRDIRLALNIGLKEAKDVADLLKKKLPTRGARAP